MELTKEEIIDINIFFDNLNNYEQIIIAENTVLWRYNN